MHSAVCHSSAGSQCLRLHPFNLAQPGLCSTLQGCREGGGKPCIPPWGGRLEFEEGTGSFHPSLTPLRSTASVPSCLGGAGGAPGSSEASFCTEKPAGASFPAGQRPLKGASTERPEGGEEETPLGDPEARAEAATFPSLPGRPPPLRGSAAARPATNAHAHWAPPRLALPCPPGESRVAAESEGDSRRRDRDGAASRGLGGLTGHGQRTAIPRR